MAATGGLGSTKCGINFEYGRLAAGVGEIEPFRIGSADISGSPVSKCQDVYVGAVLDEAVGWIGIGEVFEIVEEIGS